MKIIFLFLTVLFAQGLNINEDIYSRVYIEFQSIKNQNISEGSFIYPIKESKVKSFYDLLKNNRLYHRSYLSSIEKYERNICFIVV